MWQLLIDESFAERIIPANDSVRLLDEIVEEMDFKPVNEGLRSARSEACNSAVNNVKDSTLRQYGKYILVTKN